MQLKDCAIGDKVKVLLAADGYLRSVPGPNVIAKIDARIIGRFTLVNGHIASVLLGWDNTASIVPNDVNKNVAPHSMPGYMFMPNFHKQYTHSLWVDSACICETGATPSVIAASKNRYPGNICPCGIHLDLHPCDYHS